MAGHRRWTLQAERLGNRPVVHNYVFLKVGAEIPNELRQAMKKAGPHGLVIVERPAGRTLGVSPWQSAPSAPVLAIASSLHTSADVLRLLDEHARAPG